jgi:hypothetical protein
MRSVGEPESESKKTMEVHVESIKARLDGLQQMKRRALEKEDDAYMKKVQSLY